MYKDLIIHWYWKLTLNYSYNVLFTKCLTLSTHIYILFITVPHFIHYLRHYSHSPFLFLSLHSMRLFCVPNLLVVVSHGLVVRIGVPLRVSGNPARHTSTHQAIHTKICRPGTGISASNTCMCKGIHKQEKVKKTRAKARSAGCCIKTFPARTRNGQKPLGQRRARSCLALACLKLEESIFFSEEVWFWESWSLVARKKWDAQVEWCLLRRRISKKGRSRGFKEGLLRIEVAVIRRTTGRI